MERCDVLVVGGGPAGSSCAWSLVRSGLDVHVLDRATFPRDKICAGWITAPVLELLELDVTDYRRSGRTFQPIRGFCTSLMGSRRVVSSYNHPVSFGIRRCEFDHYLLARSGARLHLGEPLRSIRRETGSSNAGCWVVNERLAAPMLVGAGGHYCPVARYLDGHAGAQESPARESGGRDPRRFAGLLIAQEIEFAMSALQQAHCQIDPEKPELFFCDDLEGYGWCFLKEGVLNIGLGRKSGDGQRLSADVERFVADLRRWGKINFDPPARMRGHAYFVSKHSPRHRVADGVLLIGDAAGVAYPESGEGIRPAVETGLLAAATIRSAAARGRFLRDDLASYAQAFEARFGRSRPGHEQAAKQGRLHRWHVAIGQRLLGWPWFARHVVMERWFLRAGQATLPVDEVTLADGISRLVGAGVSKPSTEGNEGNEG
jgi:flavin-dependent dehydrogenase